MTDDLLPSFSFSPEEIASIKASVGAVDVDETQDTPLPEIAPKRRPGRPRKNPIIEVEEPKSESLTERLPAAPLTKREERDVAVRLANILTGATGMAGVVKPYIPMTDEEATAIAEPLASYLIRNESTSGIAREILENYDIVAMVLGVGSYGVRVYSDRKQELLNRQPPNTTAIQRVSNVDEPLNGRQPNEGISDIISIPNASRSGATPFDI